MPVRPSFVLSPQDAERLLQLGLLPLNMEQMAAAGPRRPRIRDLILARKIRYSRQDPTEHWQTYNELVRGVQEQGVIYADCEDLATVTAAEMRDPADPYHDPGAYPIVYRTGPRMSHVIVRSPRFGDLDPSITAGMGWDEP